MPAMLPAAAMAASGPATVTIPAGRFDYRSSGEFLENGYPVDATIEEVVFDKPFEIMRFQVSVGQYEQCVAANACQERLGSGRHPGHLPVTGISFRDASDYALWHSKVTGENWRLPTDKEWAYAAGERFIDDALGVKTDVDNPAQRWIARYSKYAALGSQADPEIKAPGSYGANQFGVHDMSGNIWEWTDTCYSRRRLDGEGALASETENCGVRIAAGRHRAYISFFIQDAKGGGCSVGAPPEYLGFRLVREKPAGIKAVLHRIRSVFSGQE
jgi:formylglycine-generating enzyme required for sulfatase activity